MVRGIERSCFTQMTQFGATRFRVAFGSLNQIARTSRRHLLVHRRLVLLRDGQIDDGAQDEPRLGVHVSCRVVAWNTALSFPTRFSRCMALKTNPV